MNLPETSTLSVLVYIGSCQQGGALSNVKVREVDTTPDDKYVVVWYRQDGVVQWMFTTDALLDSLVEDLQAKHSVAKDKIWIVPLRQDGGDKFLRPDGNVYFWDL